MNRSMMRIPLVLTALSLGLGPLGGVALADPPPRAAATAPAATAPAAPLPALPAPAAPAPAPPFPHANPTQGGLLDESLHHLTLRPEQRAKIEEIKASLEPSREATRAARRQLLEAMAAQVQAGAIDRAALQPKVDAVVAAEASERTVERSAIEQLHGVLDREQRAQLSSAMEARLAASHPQAHANELRHLTSELKLSRPQRLQIGAILRADPMPSEASARAAKAAEHKVAAAFKGNAFVMDRIVPNDARARTRESLDRFVVVTQAIVPLLSPDQRAAAATKMRERAATARSMGL